MKNKDGATDIHYKYIDLPDGFPLSFITHTQNINNKHGLHFHNGLEIGLCLEGTGTFFVENRLMNFKQNDVSLIFKNQPHIARSVTNSYWYFLTVDMDRMFNGWPIFDMPFYQRVFSRGSFPNNIIDGKQHPGISQVVREIFTQLTEKPTDYQNMIRGYLIVLLCRLSELEQSEPQPEENLLSAGKTKYSDILPAINHIALCYAENITVSELAALCHLSESQFRRLFFQMMGRQPMRYLTDIRLRMAATMLLNTGQSVTDISAAVGYQTLSSFYRNYKQKYGVSPHEYRHRYKQTRDDGR